MVARGSPVPRLRAEGGWALPDTCTRKRWPAFNVFAVGDIDTLTVNAPSTPRTEFSGRRKRNPSLRFIDRPLGATSHKRTNTSKWSVSDRR